MNKMKWRCYVLGQCSFQHTSTTQVFCDLSSSSLAGVPGVGCWESLSFCCLCRLCSWDLLVPSGRYSKFFRLFPGSKESLVPWGSSRGWRMRLVKVLQGLVPHPWHFYVCNLLSWSLLLVESASKLALAWSVLSPNPASLHSGREAEEWALEDSCSDSLSLFGVLWSTLPTESSLGFG